MGFANADGGTVYVGIRKDGVVLGVSDPDGVMLQIVNSLKDSLAPDIMPFVRVTTIELEEKPVIEIDVTTGTNRPYYLRERGLKPSGVYVRKRSSTQPMTEEGIREMILQNSGRSFEQYRSMNQELTFHTLQTEMQRRSIEIGASQMRTLKLLVRMVCIRILHCCYQTSAKPQQKSRYFKGRIRSYSVTERNLRAPF